VTPFDDVAFHWINGGLGPLADRILPALGESSLALPWFVVLGLIAATLGGPRWRRTLLLVGLVVAISDPANRFLVKRVFARERPCRVFTDAVLRTDRCPVSASFPSSHAVNTAAAATVIGLEHPALAVPLAFAVTIAALSRVYQGVHFPLDVLGGLLLGAMFGLTVVELARGPARRAANRALHRLRLAAAHAWTRLGERRWLAVWAVAIVSGIAFSLVTILRGHLDLAPDEAHYWEWSRRLDWSYYSKGPGIAYLIALTTRIFGDTELGVRMAALLSSVVGAVAMFVVARRITGSDRSAVLSSLLLQITPLFTGGAVIATIDPPFAACWTVALVAFERALRGGSLAAWLAGGAMVGVGFLFKYTAALLVPCVLGVLLWVPELGPQLRRPGPYLSALLAGLLTLPVWVWNRRHAWMSVAHVEKLAGLGQGTSLDAGRLLEYLGSQAGILTPWVAAILVVGMVRAARRARDRRDPGFTLLFATSAPVLLFFGLKAAQAKVQANWAAPAFIGAAIAAGPWLEETWDRTRGRRRRSVRRFAALCTALSLGLVVLTAHSYLVYDLISDFPRDLDPAARLKGWRALGLHVGHALDRWRAEGASPLLFTHQYAKASELAFYVPGHPRSYSLRLERRYEQYDVWNDLASVAGGANALYVGGGAGIHPAVELAFERCTEIEPFDDPTGNPWLGVQRLYRCEGYRGLPESFQAERF